MVLSPLACVTSTGLHLVAFYPVLIISHRSFIVQRFDDIRLVHTIPTSEGRESQSHLGLETKGTKTLGLVQNFGTCLVSDEIFFLQSRLVCFNFTQSLLGLVLIWMSSF